MARPSSDASAACYALTVPGLEKLAAKEIKARLDADIRRTAPGLVVFRVPVPDRRVLQLRTVEDVYLLLWGTDCLSHRAEDLKRITRWTAHEPDWAKALRLHHQIHPKPRGKPTYHLVAQKQGEHAYRRVDALAALARGLAGKFPASWRPADENAAVEVWLTIDGSRAVCGLRLSDRSMRHRTYKHEHRPASLRPVVAAAMAQLAELQPGHRVLDPMCGAGTILAECAAGMGRTAQGGERGAGSGPPGTRGGTHPGTLQLIAADADPAAIRAAAANLRDWENATLLHADAAKLPLADQTIDRIVSNPPFGKKLGRAEGIADLYQAMAREADRVLKPGGRAVYLVMDHQALEAAAKVVGWRQRQRIRVRILGQAASIVVWEKPAA